MIVSTTWVSSASASCAEGVSLRRKVVTVDGQSGLWFHRKVARCVLKDVEQLKITKRQVRLLKKQLTLRKEEVVAQRMNASESVDRNVLLKKIVIEQQNVIGDQAKKIKSLQRHWRKPWVWVLVGAGLGVAVTGGIAL